MRADLERRGYTFDTSTRAMGMSLDDTLRARPQIDLATARLGRAPPNRRRAAGLPRRRRLRRLSTSSSPASTARPSPRRWRSTSTGDCGIYNVATLEHARRRGLATALTAIQLHDARARGCETASLQATPAAERLYAAAGFRDLGRILEYVPRKDRTGSASPRGVHVMNQTAVLALT